MIDPALVEALIEKLERRMNALFLHDPVTVLLLQDVISALAQAPAVPPLTGQVVTVSSARGPVTGTVLADLGDVLIVGSREDFERSKVEGISPCSVGFRRSDVIRGAAPRPALAASGEAPRLTNEEDSKALWLTRRLMPKLSKP